MKKVVVVLMMLLLSSAIMAQNKVVVIPLGGDVLTVKDEKPDSNYRISTLTVFDHITGLEWQREDDHTTRNWNAAISYCTTLPLDSKGGWRLPNISELLSIVDYSSFNPAVNGNAFPSTGSWRYWSASNPVGNSTDAWIVNFYWGLFTAYTKTNSAYTHCVR
jgi:hypothetical protein